MSQHTWVLPELQDGVSVTCKPGTLAARPGFHWSWPLATHTGSCFGSSWRQPHSVPDRVRTARPRQLHTRGRPSWAISSPHTSPTETGVYYPWGRGIRRPSPADHPRQRPSPPPARPLRYPQLPPRGPSCLKLLSASESAEKPSRVRGMPCCTPMTVPSQLLTCSRRQGAPRLVAVASCARLSQGTSVQDPHTGSANTAFLCRP